MGSTSSLRVYYTKKELGQLATWRHSPDEVVDFLVSEALIHNARKHEETLKADADEKAKRDEFKKFKD